MGLSSPSPSSEKCGKSEINRRVTRQKNLFTKKKIDADVNFTKKKT